MRNLWQINLRLLTTENQRARRLNSAGKNRLRFGFNIFLCVLCEPRLPFLNGFGGGQACGGKNFIFLE
jgi:hypothetical protein